MSDNQTKDIAQRDVEKDDSVEKDTEDAVTLNEEDEQTSSAVPAGDSGDALQQILLKLDRMSLRLDGIASNTDKKITERVSELAQQFKKQDYLNSTAAEVPASDSVPSLFLSSTIGKVHVELNHEVARLRKELDEKTKENKMLHGVIQRTQTIADVTDDDIDRNFRNLRNEIERFSRTQFQAVNPRFTISDMKPSNQPLWLEARIADKLYGYFFTRPIFGHNTQFEDELAAFEHALREARVPDPDIRTWVADTLHITSRFGFSQSNPCAEKVAQIMLKSLSEHIEFAAHDTLLEDTRIMCQIAYDIAIMLRRSRTLYDWPQVHPPTRGLNEAHFTTLRGYDEPDGRSHFKQFRVRFGPVFKIGNGEAVCIRKGELMVPTGS